MKQVHLKRSSDFVTGKSCDNCELLFLVGPELNVHRGVNHKQSVSYKCNVEASCGFANNSLRLMQSHIRSHSVDIGSAILENREKIGKFSCDHCGFKGRKNAHLQSHLENAQKCKKYRVILASGGNLSGLWWCPACSGKLSNEKALKAHLHGPCPTMKGANIAGVNATQLDKKKMVTTLMDQARVEREARLNMS